MKIKAKITDKIIYYFFSFIFILSFPYCPPTYDLMTNRIVDHTRQSDEHLSHSDSFDTHYIHLSNWQHLHRLIDRVQLLYNLDPLFRSLVLFP